MLKKILTLNFLMFSFALTAQTFSGRIVNENNEPIENVYVYNSTTNSHTHTDIHGSFSVENSKVGDQIEMGILGYKKRTIILEQMHLNIKQSFQLEPKIFVLDELILNKQPDPLQSIIKMDLAKNPVNSSQQILQRVPGLFIGQHAGGGKAEQIFLRGFDIDHGTDLSLSVDGMPVNMVSHAHGQGYSDLHFLIPETIQKINFGKGPYYADKGDFNTAGYVDFKTKTALSESTINIGAGQFNTFRTLGMFKLLDGSASQNAYMAMEYLATDGFVESPQNFSRVNLFAKYTSYLNDNSRFSLTASHFTSRWDASGQIPERAVNDGSITRFGAIDDTEGGETSRSNINLQYNASLTNDTEVQANVFYSRYNFLLFSNFTFFLEDPINGDQIKQSENRDIFGFNAQFTKEVKWLNNSVTITAGTGLRTDIVKNNELSHTLNRKQTLNSIQFGDINQTNYYAFLNSEFEFGKFKVSPALRLDYIKFLYNDALQVNYNSVSKSQVIINPKLNFSYSPNEHVQWFIKTGIGFHSNDTRVVVAQPNKKTLPRAYGLDFGTIWKPNTKLLVNTALWFLLSEEEFVYVGDAGIVEPSGESQRYGLDIGLRYQFTDWLYLDTDATFTKARSLEAISGQDFIPLAPELTLTGGLSVSNFHNFSGAIKYRYLGDRAANEDKSIIAKGYFVSDANVNYQVNSNITLGLAIENIFNIEWNETQFATESRLKNEMNSVEEIHFTPGTPFSAKLSFRYAF